jgi:signal transduction histidine kinase
LTVNIRIVSAGKSCSAGGCAARLAVTNKAQNKTIPENLKKRFFTSPLIYWRKLRERCAIANCRCRLPEGWTCDPLATNISKIVSAELNKIQPAKTRAQLAKVLIIGLACVALIAELDFVTGPEIAFALFYLLPVGVSAWFGGRWVALVVAVCAAIIRTWFDLKGGRHYSHPWIVYWNGGVRLSIFVIIAILVDIIKKLTDGLQELVRLRTAALEAEIQSRKEVERVVTEISAREQQRLGADLHDQLAGHLTGLAFHAKALAESLQKRDEPETPDAEKLVGYLNQALKQLRAFCRLLAPVDTGNLEPGLTRLGAQIETAFGITCIVQTPKDPPQLGLNRARLMYNITQEAVRRAVEKQMAKHVEINLEQEGSLLRMTVTHDGQTAKEPASPSDTDLELRVMKYRAETLGGEILVQRDSQGRSRLVCQVPIDSETTPFPAMS